MTISGSSFAKQFLSLYILMFFTFGCLPLNAQDIVSVSDITGGSSVYIFKASARASVRRPVVKAKPVRQRSQRIATANKISKQYTALAKNAPRRTRSTLVDPNNLPPEPARISATEASKRFAGVGEFYLNEADYNQAVKYFRESIELDAKNARAVTGLSEALVQQGSKLFFEDQLAFAKASYDEALRLDPKNAGAYYGIAEIQSAKDEDDQAIKSYEKALQIDKGLTEIYVPLGILYYQKGDIATADKYLTMAQTAGADGSEMQYFLGLVRFAQNRNDESRKALKRAAELDATYAEPNYQLGELSMREGKTEQAIREYEKAVQLKPEYFEAWSGLGDAYMKLEEYTKAIESYKRAVRLKNNDGELYAALGDANRLAGNFNDAEGSYNNAVMFMQRGEYNPNDLADILSKTGFVLVKQCELNMRRNVGCKWNDAITKLEKALEITNDPIDRANLGWIYYNAAKMDLAFNRKADGQAKLVKAKENLEKASVEQKKAVDGTYLNLGLVQMDLGDFAGAIKSFEKVVDKKPEWNFVPYAMGTAYFKTDDFKNAAKFFRRAVDKDPKYTIAWASLGYSELRLNNQKEVEKIIKILTPLNQNEAKKLQISLLNVQKKLK